MKGGTTPKWQNGFDIVAHQGQEKRPGVQLARSVSILCRS